MNIIVGPNGSGKSTLMKIIERYFLIENDSQDVNKLSVLFKRNKLSEEPQMLDGVEVYSDYKLTSFRFVHMDELSKGGSDKWMNCFENFQASYLSMNSSTGEGVKLHYVDFLNECLARKPTLNSLLMNL